MKVLRWLTDGLFAILNLALVLYAAQQDLVQSGLVAWVLLLILQFFAIVIHETGHALAARFAGARLLTYCVGWYAYDFARKRWANRHDRNREIGGYVVYNFDRESDETNAKHGWIAAAGPLANILTALLLLVAVEAMASPPQPATEPLAVEAGDIPSGSPAIRLPDEAALQAALNDFDARQKARQRSELLEAFARIFAVLSLSIAALNLIPFEGSDGRKIWRAMRPDATNPDFS